jgi:hypothetical protein
MPTPTWSQTKWCFRLKVALLSGMLARGQLGSSAAECRSCGFVHWHCLRLCVACGVCLCWWVAGWVEVDGELHEGQVEAMEARKRQEEFFRSLGEADSGRGSTTLFWVRAHTCSCCCCCCCSCCCFGCCAAHFGILIVG